MKGCPACLADVPDDAQFCVVCGFRMAPLARKRHRQLSELLPPVKKGTIDPDPEISDTPPAQPAVTPNVAPASTAPFGTPAPGTGRPPAPPKAPRPVAAERAATSPAAEAALASTMMFQLPPEPGEADSGRQFQRFPLKVEVTATSPHNFICGTSHDISVGGLFVATDQPLASGVETLITFSVPGLPEPCHARCVVRWVREPGAVMPGCPAGMGLEFLELDSVSRAAVLVFIEHRSPINTDD